MIPDRDGGAANPSLSPRLSDAETRYVAWFHDLDAWTEYWDIYHPESCGRFYFGDGSSERGLLTYFLARDGQPAAYTAWTRMALRLDSEARFAETVRAPDVAHAVMEVDALVSRLFSKYFGDARAADVKADYLEAIFRFATNSLPPATERDARISQDDLRKRTAGRHTLEGEAMWFAWALHTEAAHVIAGVDESHPRRALLLAGIASGCSANFAWRGHRRTRSEYKPTPDTARLLRDRGLLWASDFAAAAAEVHALYRIYEWGESPDTI